MRGMNRVMLIGRLGRDPEVRQGKGGTPWGTFTIATNRPKKEGDGWIEETDWHDVKVFGEDAERCSRKLRKGSLVGVEGALVYDTWTADDGQKRRKARVAASRVHFLTDLRIAGSEEIEPETVTEASDSGAEPEEVAALF